jgi:biopolymer transport protein ExbB/TolQ
MEGRMGTLIFFLFLIGGIFAVLYNMGRKRKESAMVATKTAEFNQRNAQAMAVLKVLRKKQATHNNLTVEEREFMHILEQTERLVQKGERLTREHARVQADAAMNFMSTPTWMEYLSEGR